eukprot:TRINITY_DN92352_c0_g1_i1.p1 TRINITY_DN92352_c0_g1~~TRINITY_DN92352_c0_g1_i1.p1  ORF type:complete len:647 (-),score=157.28 TRINITY_DN92352_c0_g1_i1:74-2014(-)
MGDPWERSPWGPWNDYGRPQCGAEEVVSAITDQILTDGGTLLWQKYLERKAFTFAANTVSEAMVSCLRMCYVHHDPGEGPGEELDEGWEIEDEPEAGEIDSWARMHLPVRRIAQHNDGGSTKTSRFGRRVPTSSRGRPNSKGAEKKEKDVHPRSTPLESAIEIDQEEERLRDAKAQEEARRRDRERKAKESEKTKEEERKKVQQLHEEMSKRPHTFDTEGNLIWVDEFKADRLPKLMENFGYAVKRDPRQRAGEDMKSTMGSTGMSPPIQEDSRKKQKKKGSKNSTRKKLEVEPEFTDGFSKLQHGQPPILETMVVMPGVTLESMGKRKSGPEAEAERFMSRKEYVQLAEREVAMDGGYKGSQMFGGAGDASPQPGSMDPGSPAPPGGGGGPPPPGQAAEGAAPAQGGGGGGGGKAAEVAAAMEAAGAGKAGPQGTLPPIPAGRGGPAAAAGGGGAAAQGNNATRRPPAGGFGGPAGDGENKEGGPAQKAPPAPPPFTRNKKFEALGFVREPRYRVPELGGPQGYGSAQPPLGATMGHGLIKSGSHKEAYFFPPSVPELPGHLIRSASDTAIGSARASARKESARRPGANGDKTGEESVEEDHGRLKAEMSPAYRNFRHALMPAESSQGLNGYSGTMSSTSGSFRR